MSKPRLPKDFAVTATALGKFAIGTPINSVIEHLQADFTAFKNVEFIYHNEDPLRYDLVLNLVDFGIQLRFDPVHQRLKLIDVFDLRKQMLVINGSDTRVLNPGAEAPTLHSCMGVLKMANAKCRHEHRQIVIEAGQVFFLFPYKEEYKDYYIVSSHREQLLQKEMVFPDGSQPILSNVVITGSADLDVPVLPSLVHVQNTIHPLYGENVVLERGAGLRVASVCINFGEPVQSVILKLGAPCDIHFKVPDSSVDSIQGTDYFYNYFSLGFDVLFDGLTHVVRKFKLHTNAPDHFDFSTYHKCHMVLQLPRLAETGSSGRASRVSPGPAQISVGAIVDQQPGAVSSPPAAAASAGFEDVPLGDSEAARSRADTFSVHPGTKWTEVRQRLGSILKNPVVFHREPSANTSDPFGETMFWAFEELIFEVIPSGYIASVTFCHRSQALVSEA
eukprot:m.292890 g.292890  ORF g.292890 m.292890 type:complete len:447 (-) comp12690_c0_seq1:205-1545(-)